MKSRLLLEGFPLHLLLPKSQGKFVTLIFHDDALGSIQFSANIEKQRRVVVAASPLASRSDRERIRRKYSKCTAEIFFAAVDDLPFAPMSVGEIVMLRRRHQTAESMYGVKSVDQLLAPDGTLVVINPRFLKPPHTDSNELSNNILHRYYVFPLSGIEYIVVRKLWAGMSECPFSGLPLGVQSTMRKYLFTLMFRARLVRFVNCVTVDVRCNRGKFPLVHEILSNCQYGRKCESEFGLFVKIGWNAMLLNPSVSRSIVKMPLVSFNIDRMAKNVATIQQLEYEAPASLQSNLPKLYGTDAIGGQRYWEESLCVGIPASRFRIPGRRKRRVVTEGCNFLLELQNGLKHETHINAARLKILLPTVHIRAISNAAQRLLPEFSIVEIVEKIEHVICGRRVPLVRTHGDFWPGNILVTHSGGLTAVLDWDASKESSWPVIDLLHLLAFQNKRKGFWYCGPTITEKLMPKRLRSWEAMAVEHYFRTMGLSADLWVCFNAIYWLERISGWAQTHLNDIGYSETWIRRNVIDTAPRVLFQMHQHYH